MSLKDRIAAAQGSHGKSKATSLQRANSPAVAIAPADRRNAKLTIRRGWGTGFYDALLQFGQPKTDACFGILRGPEDLATLINLRGTGEPSKEARQKIHKFLKSRAARAVVDLKQWLGLRRGRPCDVSKQDVWVVGAALRRKDDAKYSWRKLTRKLDPHGFANDPQRATDRMRQGIESVMEKQDCQNKLQP